MPALPRKTQKVFGSSLTPSGNVAVFGSLQAGAPAFSSDPALIQSLTNFLQGLNGGVVGNRAPAIEDLNGLFLLITQQIAYLLQSGIPQWDAGTSYFTNNIVRVGAKLYVSLLDDNLNNDPTSDSNSWAPLTSKLTGATVAAAWVVFDGINAVAGNSRIISSFNVDHVVQNAFGNYTVVFANALPSQNYTLGGSCGSENGQPYGAGDDGVVVGNVTGQGNAVRSAAQCRIFTINPTNKALVASGCVSALFFSL